MVKWLLLVLADGQYEGQQLIRKEPLEIARTPQAIRGTNEATGLDNFGLALQWQPVTSWHAGYGEIQAGVSHGISEARAGDVADGIEVAVDKQHWLAETAAVGSAVSECDVGAVIQVPRVTGTESGHAECFDQGIEVSGRPKLGIRWNRRCAMSRAEPAPIARDQAGQVDFAYDFGVSASINQRESGWDVRIEVGDRLIEMGQVEAVVVPLPVWILIRWVTTRQRPRSPLACPCVP